MATLHRPIDTSQFSPEDFQKIVDYVGILIAIDRKNRRRISQEARQLNNQDMREPFRTERN